MINSNGTTTSANRISGLISGMDTESIIKNTLKMQMLKIDRQFKAKTKLEWKKESLTSISDSLKSFKNEYMSVLNSSKVMMSATSLNNFKAEVTGSGKSAVSVNAGIYATAKSFTITQATKATASTASSKGDAATGDAALNLGATLEELSDSGALTNGFTFEDDKISFKINDKEFSFNKTDSLRTVMNAVNASDVGVTMSYSSVSNKFSFTAKDTGTAASFTLSGSAFGEDGAFGIAEGTYQNGKNASLTIQEGAATRTFSSSSNNFSIDGVGITINKDFKADAANGVEAIGVDVTRDIDASIAKIKDFFAGFNKLYGSLTSKLNEPRYNGFDPLTDEQRSAMKEADIKLWEDKAKSALLRGDPDVTSIANAMRSAMTEPMSQADGYSFAKIGISFGAFFSGDKDSIVIDEEKLRKALTENPEAVQKLFYNDQAKKDSPTSEMGFTQRLSKAIDNTTSKLKDYTFDSLSKSIKNYSKIMDELTIQMNKKEEALWAQFSAMESAIAKANSQGNWLSGIMG